MTRPHVTEPQTPFPSQPHHGDKAEYPHGDQQRQNSDRIASPSLAVTVVPEIDLLVVEDSDSDEPQPPLTRRASAALGVVKSKIIRHLSAENNPKRQSHISVGNSQEEIARRAELRRLRHRRIQDELQGESDDDASNRSQKTLRHLHSLTSLHQACVGPRDIIEFTVPEKANHTLESNSLKSTPQSQKSTEASTQDQTGKRELNDKKQSLVKTKGDEENLWPVNAHLNHSPSTTIRRRLPEAGSRKSLHSNDVTQTEKASSLLVDSRLRGDQLSWDDQSTLGVWLIAQGMQSGEDSGLCADEVEPRVPSPVHEGGTAPFVAQELKEGHVEASNKPASTTSINSDNRHRDTTTPPPGLRSSPRQHRLVHNDGDLTESELENDALQYFPIFSQSLLEESPEVIPLSALKPVRLDSSPKYNSVRPNIHPSPTRSRLNIPSLTSRDLRSLELSPFHCKDRYPIPNTIC